MIRIHLAIGKLIISMLLVVSLVCSMSHAGSKAISSQSSSNVQGEQKVRLENFFFLKDKSLAVWLTKSENRLVIEFPEKIGASATVPMEKGAQIKLVAKGDNSSKVLWDFSLQPGDEKITFMVRKLPGGKLAPVLLGTKLYAGRFRLVYEYTADMAATGKTPLKTALYFIEGETEPPL